jgi:alpha-glucosidase (family GH31 glycosyl hydrolase)
LIFYRCDFTFDPDYFPDPAAYLKAIKEKYNVKICLWSKFDCDPRPYDVLIQTAP